MGAAEAWGDGSYEPREAPSADPDPSEADLLKELGDEIARLVGHSHATKQHVLTLVAEFDRRGGWKAGGHRSCAHWPSFRTGYALGTAREHVRVARERAEGDGSTAGSTAGSMEPLLPRKARRGAARRRADAVGLLAERALSAGFGGEDAPISGTRAERYQVFLFVERPSLEADGEPGHSELEDGTRVSFGTSRRLTCDAVVVQVDRDEEGWTVECWGRRGR